jgi:hypothetical protein
MINHIARGTALLALTSLSTVAAIRNNNYDKPHGLLRKPYYSKGHDLNNVQTKCNQVIEGDPKQCMIVCIEVTSTKNGDELIDEHSRVSQRECEDGWMYSPTQFPTYYLTVLVDY